MPFLALLKSVEATETFDYYSRCSGELNFNKKANESNLTSLILDVSHPHQTVDTDWNAGGSLIPGSTSVLCGCQVTGTGSSDCS